MFAILRLDLNVLLEFLPFKVFENYEDVKRAILENTVKVKTVEDSSKAVSAIKEDGKRSEGRENR